MKGPLSLRVRLLLGAAFWTVGLFGLSIVIWHVALGNRQPPSLFFLITHHAMAFAAGCAVLLILGLLQVRRGWSPINQLRQRLARLRAGDERRLEGRYPAEVEPLVGDLNALLDQREQSLARARAKAGDLAHGLKTPLAVLAQEAERAAAEGHADLAASIRQQVERMRRQVDYQLAQARADASGQSAAASPVAVRESVDGLVRTLQRLHAERGLAFTIDVGGESQVRVPRDDLDEMLGNLLDNACKWAAQRIAISVRPERDGLAILVDDDGPGIEPAMREAVLRRGVRADELAPGSGLGLSIVRDLAFAYGGRIALEPSPIGGTRAVLVLPPA